LKPETEQKVKEILKQIGLGGKDEAVAQAITDLSDEAKLEFFTYIYPDEDETFSVLETIAERYQLIWLGKLTKQRLKLRTSVNGWRANQMENIAKETQKQKQGNWLMRNIFRRKGDKNQSGIEEFE